MKTHSNLPTTVEDITRVTLMKGLAIIAVVTLHILSSLPPETYRLFPAANFNIFIDQLCRFSVPVFIALSGYALVRKYENRFNWKFFYSRRVARLLPLYFLWGVGLWVLFRFIPAWYPVNPPFQWWEVLFLGKGDYHLYFIPLIFQLYVLFPFFLYILKRFPRVFLIGVCLVQFATLLFFWHQDQQLLDVKFNTDQEQYIVFLAWLAYFGTGMFLGMKKIFEKAKNWLWITIIWLVGLVLISWSSSQSIQSGIDPLVALKFTRLLIMPYALSSVVLAIIIPWEKIRLPAFIMFIWKKIGEFSFIIYLAHTLILRLIYDTVNVGVNNTQIAITIGFVIALTITSYFFERK